MRIMVKKHRRVNPFTSGTSHLLKQVAFVLRRRIRADDQVATRLWNAFVRRFSVVRRNPQGGQAGNWVMYLTWQCGGCCVRDCLSGRTNFNCCRSPMIDHIGKTCTDKLNRLKEDNLFLDKIVFSDEATFHLSGKVNRHNLIIWGSQNPN
jgi:hypothetical protein